MVNPAGLEIRSRRSPWRRVALIVLSVLAVSGGSYLYGYSKGGSDNVLQREQLAAQAQTIEGQVELLAGLRRDLARLDQGRRVDSVAIDGVKSELKDQQQEVLELREEIAFYRGIVSPSEARTGILIQRFELMPLAEDRLFQYRLVLTQVLKNDRVARGVAEVFVAGVMNGRSQRISLQELAEDVKKKLSFRFKYFQMFEGSLMLPDGFVAHSVEVEVKPRKSRSSISESFPWKAPESVDEVMIDDSLNESPLAGEKSTSR